MPLGNAAYTVAAWIKPDKGSCLHGGTGLHGVLGWGDWNAFYKYYWFDDDLLFPTPGLCAGS